MTDRVVRHTIDGRFPAVIGSVKWSAVAVAGLVLLGACTSEPVGEAPADSGTALETGFPAAPPVIDGPIDADVADALERLAPSLSTGRLDRAALRTVAESHDARLAWFISDLLRFTAGADDQLALGDAFRQLTGVDPRDDASAEGPWRRVTNLLIDWDLPAASGYRELKADLFLGIEPGWEPFFADADSEIDWRFVSWGGVFIDDRPEGDPRPCAHGCIPALDDPALTDAAGGDWYPDDAIVFGVVVGKEAVAFPKNVMEVHEMVNVTIGSRRLGIPYCTLCASAQAYFTDSVPDDIEIPVLRTSGLLSRSNKVMYDLNTKSVFDTFTGRALSGPLLDAGVVLEQTTVVTSTWAEWKRAHRDTKIVAEDGGIGRSYPADPLRGRDDAGPIFPIGEADPRLPVQTLVLGVIAPDGTPIAFPADEARAALEEGERVVVEGVELIADGGGLRALGPNGEEVAAHEAFWFAWSQFHPLTLLWQR